MNTPAFIARKVALKGGKRFTRWIIGIAIAAVALSLSVMIISFAMISGFKKEISEKIFGFWGHIHITDANISRSMESIPILKDQDFLPVLDTLQTISYPDQATILGIPVSGQNVIRNIPVNITHLYPYALTPAIINTTEDFEGVIVRGLGEDYSWDRFAKYIINGSRIAYNANGSSDQVLISQSIADRLRVKAGDFIIINVIKDGQQIKRRVSISGIYKTGLEEYDRKFIIADLKKVQELLQWKENQVAGYEIILKDLKHLNLINDAIYFDYLPSNLYSETIRDKFPNIFEWLDLQDLNAVVILVLMILVSVINMITSIIILIIERAKMIGVLKSLGMTNWNIRKIFMYYGAYIILFGLLVGNFIGISICLLQKYFGFIKLDEENYYLSQAPINIDVFTLVGLNVAAFLVIISFLFIPTIIVSRMSPVKILRFQ